VSLLYQIEKQLKSAKNDVLYLSDHPVLGRNPSFFIKVGQVLINRHPIEENVAHTPKRLGFIILTIVRKCEF
jgi:hypothetical protein